MEFSQIYFLELINWTMVTWYIDKQKVCIGKRHITRCSVNDSLHRKCFHLFLFFFIEYNKRLYLKFCKQASFTAETQIDRHTIYFDMLLHRNAVKWAKHLLNLKKFLLFVNPNFILILFRAFFNTVLRSSNISKYIDK